MPPLGKLLTVVVPSYNMEEYLPKCLSSLLVSDPAQLQRLDVIVVNDGSKDETSAIAHRFERDHPGIFRVIDKPNGNYGSCINAALPEATGTYVKILDADDSVSKPGLEALLSQLQKESEKGDQQADLVVTDYNWVRPDGSVLLHVSHPLPPGENRSFSDMPPLACFFQMHGLAYRTAIFDRIRYRQTEGISYTDIEWALEPCVAVRRITYLPVSVTMYLVGRSGQTVDHVTMANNYWMVAKVARELAIRFPERLRESVPEARDYFKRQTLSFLSLVYQHCIYGIHGRRANADLRDLDNCIRAIPETFRETESFRVLQARFPVRLIHAWRRHPGIGTPIVVANGLFLRVKEFKRSFKTLFR